MKDIQVGDIVKFVPYYIPSGAQGSSLTLQMPKYDCIALVLKTVKGKKRSSAIVMLPNRVKKSVGFASIDTLFRLL
jgi:hypothetical protein